MTLEVWWDGLWTLSFGLPQFHGHGSWLVCEVAGPNNKDTTSKPVSKQVGLPSSSDPRQILSGRHLSSWVAVKLGPKRAKFVCDAENGLGVSQLVGGIGFNLLKCSCGCNLGPDAGERPRCPCGSCAPIGSWACAVGQCGCATRNLRKIHISIPPLTKSTRYICCKQILVIMILFLIFLCCRCCCCCCSSSGGGNVGTVRVLLGLLFLNWTRIVQSVGVWLGVDRWTNNVKTLVWARWE